MLLPRAILSLVFSSVGPCLHALPALQIVDPVSLVHGSVAVKIHSEAVGFAVDPLALEAISVFELDPAFAVHLVVAPVAFVGAIIGEGLRAVSFAFSEDPLARVRAS